MIPFNKTMISRTDFLRDGRVSVFVFTVRAGWQSFIHRRITDAMLIFSFAHRILKAETMPDSIVNFTCVIFSDMLHLSILFAPQEPDFGSLTSRRRGKLPKSAAAHVVV